MLQLPCSLSAAGYSRYLKQKSEVQEKTVHVVFNYLSRSLLDWRSNASPLTITVFLS
jgi:hypothetical protein